MRAWILAMAAAVSVWTATAVAQQPQTSPYQRYAPIDLTGTWVSVVTEDWEYRMLAPAKGDFANLPLTQAARGAANRADVSQLEKTGRACDAYGAPVVMREPGRVRIAWQDATTLRIETDAGSQTRLLNFGNRTPTGPPSRQGDSAAEWQYAGGFDPARAAPPKSATPRIWGSTRIATMAISRSPAACHMIEVGGTLRGEPP